MRVRWIFFLIFLMLIASMVTTFMMSASESSLVSWLARLSCILALLLMLIFYRSVMKPLRSISNGVDLLRAQDFSSRLAHVGQYEADRIVDMFNGMMTALKEERLRMREQNHFLYLLIDVSPMGIIILSDDRILTANPSAASFLDVKEAGSLSGLRLPQLDSQLGRELAALPQGHTETVRLSDSMIYRCSRLSFMDKGFAHPFMLIEKLTDEVMKAEKKSYEKVIRVIAHEVNNTMAGVNSMLSTASMLLGEKAEENADLLEVMNVCENRCMAMSKFITSFADVVKIPEANLIAVDLNAAIERWGVMLESLCAGRDIVLKFNLCPGELMVRLDPVLMEQVLINIVKNSAESIGKHGEITVSTSSSPATLIVTDNGPGISPDTANKLFSPFFSTKVNGHGIGLLFTSEVLHKHGCRFSLLTDADDLTRFTIRF